MKVRLRQIPEEGLDVEFQLPSEEVRRGLSSSDGAFSMLSNAVDCSVHADIDRKEIFLRGTAATSIHPECARCGESFEAPLEVDITLTCSPEEKSAKGADFQQEADDGLVFYRKEELDLSEIVREQILLALPIVSLCKDDCLGLCPHCGVNLNLGEHACPRRTLQ